MPCKWSNYGSWSQCSVTCGSGVQQRERHLISGRTSDSSSDDCVGQDDSIETRKCQLLDCKGKP